MTGTAEFELYNYLRSLRENLVDIPEDEREDIIREINAHVRDRAQEPNHSVTEILRRLGSAEDLAAQYRREALIRKATGSISPVVILKATLQLATRGLEGLAIFLGAIFGYGAGIGFLITAILKPFFPRETGLWVGPGVFDFGIHTPARYGDSVHEVLGWSYIPVALVLGLIFLVVTTMLIRKWLRSRWQRGVKINSIAHAAA
ncbi:MAG TPA: DUF1700 domain-containing protein [Thermoanaerobaculia bacterium]|nr:DUF1700 domain-containing protein [Thermoanaerobaculia bacterium]